MKRMFLLAMSSLLLYAFSGCKKELEDGGISFSFTGNQTYEYTSLHVMVSIQPNVDPLKEAYTTHVEDELKITGLTPGTYYWSGTVAYRHPQFWGSHTSGGKVIVEKGKLMRITLEH
jgi:hypothetical protein